MPRIAVYLFKTNCCPSRLKRPDMVNLSPKGQLIPRSIVPYQRLSVVLYCWQAGQSEAAGTGLALVSKSLYSLTHIEPSSLTLWPLSSRVPYSKFGMANKESWLTSTGSVTFSVPLPCKTLMGSTKMFTHITHSHTFIHIPPSQTSLSSIFWSFSF